MLKLFTYLDISYIIQHYEYQTENATESFSAIALIRNKSCESILSNKSTGECDLYEICTASVPRAIQLYSRCNAVPMELFCSYDTKLFEICEYLRIGLVFS